MPTKPLNYYLHKEEEGPAPVDIDEVNRQHAGESAVDQYIARCRAVDERNKREKEYLKRCKNHDKH
jgi:uncharacterized membrane protein YebE (DUF533 family)